MLRNCEKMVVISSTTKEWPQNHHQIDEKNLMGSTGRFMQEKPGQEPQQQQQQQQQQPLKCPRCDSSNTKFCYYNNYSLSQPRHFCKACKRYWTRGGTLRNVPVGGGYRKNKRTVKRPAASNSIDGTSSNPNPHTQPQIDINPLFYGLPTNPSDMNLPFSRFNNALGLGFSSGLTMCNDVGDDNYYRNSFNQITSNSILSSYNPSFGSSSSPTMASFLASSLHQQKLINGGINKSTQAPNHFNNLASFEELQMTANGEAARIGVKAEDGGQNRMDWNQMEQIGLVDLDPTTLYWNTGSVGAWHDPSNIGSSVTSLI